MKKLILSILLIVSVFAFTNAQSLSQNQSGNDLNDLRVSVTIFPNPVVDIVTVLFDRPVSEPIIDTFNVNGQKITPPAYGQGDGSNKTDLDFSGFAPGIYLLNIYNGKEIIKVQKILKKLKL